jgi:uncharacterized repeat protein (TIGR01451 family)
MSSLLRRAGWTQEFVLVGLLATWGAGCGGGSSAGGEGGSAGGAVAGKGGSPVAGAGGFAAGGKGGSAGAGSGGAPIAGSGGSAVAGAGGSAVGGSAVAGSGGGPVAGAGGVGGSAVAGSGGSAVAGAGGGVAGSGGSVAGSGGSVAGTGGSVAGSGGSVAGSGGSTTGVGGSAGSSPPLAYDVSVSSAPAIPGQPLLYTVTVGNVSNHTVDGVGVLFRVPTGSSFYYTTDAEPDSSACGNGTCSADEEATWTLGSMRAGETRTIVVNTDIAATVANGTTLGGTFTFSAVGLNSTIITKSVLVSGPPSAQLSLGTATNPLTPGQKVTLDVDVGQVGAGSLVNTTLKISLPGGVAVSAIGDGGTQAGSEVTWSLGSVPVGGTAHRWIDLAVSATAPPGAILKAVASLSFDGGADVDNVAEYALSVVSAAPVLGLAVAAGPDPAVPGGTLLYTVTVTNLAQRATDGVTLMLRVPRGLSFYYTTDTQPDSSACGNGTCSSEEEASWNLASMPAGSSQTISINTYPAANTIGDGSLIRADFQLTALGVPRLNAVKTVSAYSHPGAQLALGTVSNPVTPGQAFTLDVDVGQVGAAGLVNGALRVTLPSGLTAGAISNGGTTTAGGDITWTLGDIPISTVLHRTIAVTADAALPPGTILTSKAALTFDGGPPIDAQTQLSVSVVDVALPITLSIAPTPVSVKPGNRLLYTMTVTNTAARAIDGVTVLLRVPTGLSFYYTTDANPDSSACGNGTCSANEEASWSLGTLAVGAVQLISVNPLVAATLLEGSLITLNTQMTATGLATPLLVQTTVPAHQ